MRLIPDPFNGHNLTEDRIEKMVRLQLLKVEKAKYLYMDRADRRHWDGWKAGLYFVLKDCLGKEDACDES